MSVRGKNRSRPVLGTKQEKCNTLYNFFYNIFSQKQRDECSSPILYILESESKYESSVRESKSSHESREWSLESDSSPENSDSSRTRVRVQDSSTPSLECVWMIQYFQMFSAFHLFLVSVLTIIKSIYN